MLILATKDGLFRSYTIAFKPCSPTNELLMNATAVGDWNKKTKQKKNKKNVSQLYELYSRI